MEKLRDARNEPLCTICGQPEQGHPVNIQEFHAFTTEPQAKDASVERTPTTLEVPADNPPSTNHGLNH